jgi:hypothetical protein
MIVSIALAALYKIGFIYLFTTVAATTSIE